MLLRSPGPISPDTYSGHIRRRALCPNRLRNGMSQRSSSSRQSDILPTMVGPSKSRRPMSHRKTDLGIPCRYPVFLREFGAAPASLAVELSASPVHDEAEIEAAVTAFAREPRGGLIPAPDAFINTRRYLIMALAERHRLPAIYGFRQFVTEGALLSYGPDAADIVRRSASYVDRILKGERATALPVQAPVKYDLVLNLKTANALGLTVPPTLLARADEVIE